jgi:malonate transporter
VQLNSGLITTNCEHASIGSFVADILTITMPFFIIIFLGSLSCKIGWFTEEQGRTLARFAFFVVLPPFMFLAITSSPISERVDFSFLLQYELSTIIIFSIAAVVGRRFFLLKDSESSVFALNSTMPNYGYIGVPLCLLAFGSKAAMPMALILVADTIVLLVLAAFAATRTTTHSLKTSLYQIISSMSRNPLLLSVLIGLSVSSSGYAIPKTPLLLLEILAGAAAPTALFALGITLVGQPILSVKFELGFLVLIKLFLHPILTFAIFLSWPLLGFEMIDVVWIKVAILFSCLPIAANVYALSVFYRSYTGRTATAIMLTTILASVTVPLTLFCLETFL